jgi:hypothetical protein
MFFLNVEMIKLTNMCGYIQLHRKIKDWAWYHDLPVKSAFIHCLLSANFMQSKFGKLTIQAGQFVTSYERFADQSGLTKKQVRRAIDVLQESGEIVWKGHGKFSLVTLVNWGSYQGLEIAKGQTKGTSKGITQGISQGTSQGIYNKEGNKETIKEGNKESVYTRENFIDDLLGEFKTDTDLRSVTKTWLQKKKVITEKSMQISKAEIQGHNKSEMYAAIMAAADKGWAQLYSRKDKQSKGTSTSLPAGKPWLDPATIAAAKASAERLKKLENRSEGVTQF